jgi:hypothetical protein
MLAQFKYTYQNLKMPSLLHLLLLVCQLPQFACIGLLISEIKHSTFSETTDVSQARHALIYY